MPDCLIISTDAGELNEELSRVADTSMAVECCTSAEEALVAYADQTILFGSPDLIATLLPELPKVDWVQSTWAGVKPLTDLDRRDYTLTGVRDVFGPQISEYVMGYLLAHELKVVERLKQQRQQIWFDSPSGILHGKRLGIMGTGSIGAHIAQMGKAFGQTVTGLSNSGTALPVFDEVFPVSQIDRFLDGLDYVVSTLPQTDDTNDLLDRAALARLPAHAYFINVGRGNVVDDDALVAALENNELAGAALDVFDVEPIRKHSPLWTTPGLSITAHIAAISHPSLIVPIFVDNYRRYVDKQPLKNMIDFDRGY